MLFVTGVAINNEKKWQMLRAWLNKRELQYPQYDMAYKDVKMMMKYMDDGNLKKLSDNGLKVEMQG